MKKANIAAAGMLSVAMLMGTPAVHALAAKSAVAVVPQSQQVTRGEFFKLVGDAIELPAVSAKGTYKDVAPGHPLYSTVNKLYGNHIISGYADHTIRLNQSITEAEALSIIGRALGMPQQPVPSGSSSLSSKHWAYSLSTWFNAAHFAYDWKQSANKLTKQKAEGFVRTLLSTGKDAENLLKENQQKQQGIKSFRMAGDMHMSMVLDKKVLASMTPAERKQAEVGAAGMTVQTKAEFSLPDGIHMTSSMKASGDANIPGDMPMDQYIIGKDMYVKVPGDKDNPSGWMKMENAFPFSMEQMMKQQTQSIPPQLAKKLFYRSLGGNQLAFQGRIDKLSEMTGMLQNMQGMDDMTKAIEQADNSIQSIYMQGVITVDPATKLTKASSMQIVLTFKGNAAQQGMPFTQMIMSQNMSYSDFDGKIVIQLLKKQKMQK